jgi:Enhanced disease susceptibility 1 protein EP domain
VHVQGVLPAAFGEVKPPSNASAHRVAQPSCIAFGERGSHWVNRANNFRELVEPFDIANYYRLELDRSSGHYLDGDNRVDIYGRLEHMWLQHEQSRKSARKTYKSSVPWAEAMRANKKRIAPETPAVVGTPVKRLPPAELEPPGTLPLVHKSL